MACPWTQDLHQNFFLEKGFSKVLKARKWSPILLLRDEAAWATLLKWKSAIPNESNMRYKIQYNYYNARLSGDDYHEPP